MKLYLAGPMRDIPEFNFPAFAAAAADLRAQHYLVWSPHESELEAEWAAAQGASYQPATGTAGDQHATLRCVMRTNLPHVLTSDGVAVLDGWEVGCQIETYVAFQCGIPVKAYEFGVPYAEAYEFKRYQHPHIIRQF